MAGTIPLACMQIVALEWQHKKPIIFKSMFVFHFLMFIHLNSRHLNVSNRSDCQSLSLSPFNGRMLIVYGRMHGLCLDIYTICTFVVGSDLASRKLTKALIFGGHPTEMRCRLWEKQTFFFRDLVGRHTEGISADEINILIC